MAAQLIPDGDFRGPGCTERCEVVMAIAPGRFGRSELLLHDPASHEEYGRVTAGPMGETAVIRTGSLVIDRWQRTAHSDGRLLPISGREWEILDYLAGRPDRFCSAGEIVSAIWGHWSSTHLIHVFITRLRSRLGPNAHLIETAHNHGYRLSMVPPVEVEDVEPQRKPYSWSRLYRACVCCGRTRLPHVAHGRCTRCRTRVGSRWPHYGPCAAPPTDDADGVS